MTLAATSPPLPNFAPLSIHRRSRSVSFSVNGFFFRTYTFTDADKNGFISIPEVAVSPYFYYQGYSVPRDIASHFPALMHLRLYGMNANGKLYELDAASQINP